MSNIDSNKKILQYQLGQDHVFESLWLKFYNNSQGAWVLKIKEALKLREVLQRYKPKHILELGTGIGCATELMAFSVPEASIYTVEQSQKCIDIAKKLISPQAQERIYFKHALAGLMKPIYEINPSINFMGYATPYDWRFYDFILVDGPGPIMAEMKNPETGETWKYLAELPGGDIIKLLPLMKDGTIVFIDKRQIMSVIYKRFLSEYLELVEESGQMVVDDDLVGEKTDFPYTVFKRNNKQLNDDLSNFVNADLSYQALLKNRYFDKL